MIEVTQYLDLNEPELVSAWDGLASEGAVPNLFAGRTWVTAWAARFAAGRSVRVLVAREDGAPVGLVPLVADAGGVVELPVNFLSPRGEFTVRERLEGPVASAFLKHLRGAGFALLLRGVPVGSGTLAAVRGEAAGGGFLLAERSTRESPFIEIDGTWEDYYAGRRRKATHEWERKMRKLDAVGDTRVLRFESGMDAGRLVEDFIAVESRSWKEKNGTSIHARGVERFYHDVSDALAISGSFLPFWLEIDGQIVAFLYGAVHDGVYYAMKTSFDEAFSRLSPGIRLFHEAVRHAFGAGLARFDFLGERARWKDEWATGRLRHVNVRLYPTTARGRVAHLIDTRVKPLARRLRGGSS